jgi:hypothetical protein
MLELQQLLVNERIDNDHSTRHGLMTVAERELVAFTRAATDLFGPEQARPSANDWLDEVGSMGSLPGPTSHEWRLVTAAALARLAIRMTVALRCQTATGPTN